MKKRGQAIAGLLIPIAIATVISLAGSIAYTTKRIDASDDKLATTREDVATIKANLVAIQEQNKEMRDDIKTILKTIR